MCNSFVGASSLPFFLQAKNFYFFRVKMGKESEMIGIVYGWLENTDVKGNKQLSVFIQMILYSDAGKNRQKGTPCIMNSMCK